MLYAVGDIRQNSSSQLISVAGDGATAAVAASRKQLSRTRRDGLIRLLVSLPTTFICFDDLVGPLGSIP